MELIACDHIAPDHDQGSDEDKQGQEASDQEGGEGEDTARDTQCASADTAAWAISIGAREGSGTDSEIKGQW